MACHIRHWRSGHKYECFETEKEADEARHIIHDRGTAMLVEKSDMVIKVSIVREFMCLMSMSICHMQVEVTSHN